MTTRRYEKLVRDRIPEIIAGNGQRCVCETLSDARYLEMLDAKLDEELAEYQESKSLEELADLLEVIRAVAQGAGQLHRGGRSAARGESGSARRLCGKIFLREVSDPD